MRLDGEIDSLEGKKLVEVGFCWDTYYDMTLYYCEDEQTFYIDDSYETHTGGFNHREDHIYAVDKERARKFCLGCEKPDALEKFKKIIGEE